VTAWPPRGRDRRPCAALLLSSPPSSPTATRACRAASCGAICGPSDDQFAVLPALSQGRTGLERTN